MNDTERDMATIVRNEDRRTSAELTDGGVRAPQVYVLADEGAHGDAIQAVARAVADEPNAVDSPAVRGRDDGDFGDLTFTFLPNELPVVGEGGGLEGWLPPYRAEENIREALLDRLPDGWDLETERQGRIVLYEE